MKEFQSVVRENARWNETPFLYLTVWELINTIEVLECVWKIERIKSSHYNNTGKWGLRYEVAERKGGISLL